MRAAVLLAIPLLSACNNLAQRQVILTDQRSIERFVSRASPAVVEVLAGSPTGIDQGSGFVVDESGIILTHGDVVGGASALFVKAATSKTYERAHLLARDDRTGVALLRVARAGWPSLSLGDSDSLRAGSQVTAVGSPPDIERTVSTGIVTSRTEVNGREVLRVTNPIPDILRGGPLLDADGRVVGVALGQIGGEKAGSVALPINEVRDIVLAARGGGPEMLAEAPAAEPAVDGRASRRDDAAEPAVTPPGRPDVVLRQEDRAVTPPRPVNQPAPSPSRPQGEAGARRGGAAVESPPAEAEPAAARPQRPPPAAAAGAEPAAAQRPRPAGSQVVNLAGRWRLTNQIQESSYAPFRGLQLGFLVRFEQSGTRIVGRGEKRWENGRAIGPGGRSPIYIEGTVEESTLTATFTEHGQRRTTTGIFSWTVAPDGRRLLGSFRHESAGGFSTADRLR